MKRVSGEFPLNSLPGEKELRSEGASKVALAVSSFMASLERERKKTDATHKREERNFDEQRRSLAAISTLNYTARNGYNECTRAQRK